MSDELREAAEKYVAWQYRMPGAPRFTLTDLRAALDARPDSPTLDVLWASGYMRYRAVWVGRDGSLVVNANRYGPTRLTTREQAYEQAASSRSAFFDDWAGQTIVVEQGYPWSDEQAKELAQAALAARPSPPRPRSDRHRSPMSTMHRARCLAPSTPMT